MNPRNDLTLLEQQDGREDEGDQYYPFTSTLIETDHRCKHHPRRKAVEPVAYRLCGECREESQARYADERSRIYVESHYSDSTGEFIGWETHKL